MDDIVSGEPLDGTYRLEALLGRGGMGAVYRASHLGTTRTVAVKVIHPRYSHDPEFVERFRREAEAAGRLRHPNVVDVTDFGFAATPSGQVAYLVMEYLDGRSLGQVLDEEKRLSTGSAVDILEQVCSAVEEAHRLGIVHRDLKPDNIWLEPNRRGGFTVKVLDFGLAKLSTTASESSSPTPWRADAEGVTGVFRAADSGIVTRAGSVTGTPLYMSPEQCRGGEVGAPSDIYSLGVVAYRMLAGEPPFSGDALELIRLHSEVPAPSLRARSPDVPRRLAALVMNALAKDPAGRPEGAAGFGAALRASAEGSGALLRHAVSLYSEHFPSFFRLSLLANGPLIVFATIVGIIDAVTPDGSVSTLISAVILLGMVALNLFAYAAINAATVPLVAQLARAPLGRPSVTRALAALQRRGAAFAASTLVVTAVTFVGLIALVVPGIAVAVWHSLYPAVVVMERLSVGVSLRRARSLVRRVWTTAIVIAILQFTLPALVWIASADFDFILRFDDNWQPREIRYGFSMSSGSLVYQLLNVVVTPLTGIMTAELYLKARHAGGERIEAAP